MTHCLRYCVATILLAVTPAALASFHLFRIEQLYSNADRSVQFIVMRQSPSANGENLWEGHQLTSTSPGNTAQTFTFPADLPSSITANRRVLIATDGFAALGLVTPDYVVPNGFLATLGGMLDYAGVDQVEYSSLPTDGINAIDRNGAMIQNVATNFAGQSASVSAPAAIDLNQHGLTGSWYESATSGQGFEVEVFADLSAPGTGRVQVSWFTYDSVVGGAERQRWYTLSGPVTSGQPTASLTIYQNTGGNFNAPPVTNAQAVGTATLSFDTCTSGQISYTFSDGTGRAGTIPLVRLLPNVTCSTTTPHLTNADFALSGNWFGGAATSGQGFTVEVNPNAGAFFAAWYTYLPSGTATGPAGQRWFTAQPTAIFAPGSRSIPVQIFETTGGTFDTPTPPGQQTVPVGSGTMAFQSCLAATFSFTFTGGSSNGISGTIVLQRVGPVPKGCTS